MLLSDDTEAIEAARHLATQARDPAPHYQHSKIGFNYRLSNLLAGVGRAQLASLEDRVKARRRINRHYRDALGGLSGLSFMEEAEYGRCTFWLTCVTIDPEAFGASRDDIREALAADNIEARPVWKPLHMQPVFADSWRHGGQTAEMLFERGLCLPSGSAMTDEDMSRVIRVVRSCCAGAS